MPDERTDSLSVSVCESKWKASHVIASKSNKMCFFFRFSFKLIVRRRLRLMTVSCRRRCCCANAFNPNRFIVSPISWATASRSHDNLCEQIMYWRSALYKLIRVNYDAGATFAKIHHILRTRPATVQVGKWKWKLFFAECRIVNCSFADGIVLSLWSHTCNWQPVDRCTQCTRRSAMQQQVWRTLWPYSKCFAYNDIGRSTQSLCMSHLSNERFGLFSCRLVDRRRDIWLAMQWTANDKYKWAVPAKSRTNFRTEKGKFRKCQDPNDCVDSLRELRTEFFNYFYLSRC